MTQRERDRLVVLKKAQKKLITQRRLSEKTREKAMRILSQEVYRGFGPTLASEYLAQKHRITIGREALRQLMRDAGLWRSRERRVEDIHQWRPRRSSRGELVQWDTSEHDWLEGRSEKLYLIHMIDDATSELLARFVRSDSTEENMRLLWSYLERHGRPLAFYTDKASDLWLAKDGAAHLLYLQRSVASAAMRNRFFPGVPVTVSLEHCVVRNNQVARRQTILAGGEGVGSEYPAYARFHANQDGRLFVLASVRTESAGAKAVFDNRIIEILPDLRHSESMRLDLRYPFVNFITATERGGSRPSNIIDVLGICVGASTNIRYAALRL
jgi:hypothetical protein